MKKRILLLASLLVLFSCNPGNKSNNNEEDTTSVQYNEEVNDEDIKYYTYKGEPSFDVFLSFFHDTILPLNDHYIKALMSFGDKLIPKEFSKFNNNEDNLIYPEVKFEIYDNLIGVIFSEKSYSNFYLNIYDKQGNLKTKYNLNNLTTIDGMHGFAIDENFNLDITYSGMPVFWFWQYNDGCANYMSAHGEESDEQKFKIMPDGSIKDLQPGLTVVTNFLNYLSYGNFDKAYQLQQNPAWRTKENFASVKAFGGISNIEVEILEFTSINKNSAKVHCKALYKDTINGNTQISQNFHINKIDDNWLITKMEVLKFEKTAQYTNNDNFEFCEFKLRNITEQSFDFYLLVVSAEKCEYNNKAGEIKGTAYFLENDTKHAVFDTETCILDFYFDNKKITIKQTECYDYKHSDISFEGIYTTLSNGTISELDLKTEILPIYEKFEEASPKTASGNYNDIIEQYNEIIKGVGYTQENPEIARYNTNVILKKKNEEIKMIEITESARLYDNKFQYFYKNDKLFYVYIELESANEDNYERITEKRKFYFAESKCILWLFNNSEGNKKYPEYDSKGNEILQDGNEYLQRTKNNKWNEF